MYAARADNDSEIEALLKEGAHRQLLPMCKQNAQRGLSPSVAFVQPSHRKMIETVGSVIAQMLPKSLHAVTPQGCELQVALFVVAYSLSRYNEF